MSTPEPPPPIDIVGSLVDAVEPIKGQLLLYGGLALGVKVALVVLQVGWKIVRTWAVGSAADERRDADGGGSYESGRYGRGM